MSDKCFWPSFCYGPTTSLQYLTRLNSPCYSPDSSTDNSVQEHPIGLLSRKTFGSKPRNATYLVTFQTLEV